MMTPEIRSRLAQSIVDGLVDSEQLVDPRRYEVARCIINRVEQSGLTVAVCRLT